MPAETLRLRTIRALARELKREAQRGVFRGQDEASTKYRDRCSFGLRRLHTKAIFTRDEDVFGTSPIKRLHLSLSFWETLKGPTRFAPEGEIADWMNGFFDDPASVWLDQTVSAEGMVIYHLFAFTDDDWNVGDVPPAMAEILRGWGWTQPWAEHSAPVVMQA